MDIGQIIGDIVCIKLVNPDAYKDIGISETIDHFLIKGKDQLGLWVKHPKLEYIKILDSQGKPLPPKDHIKEEIDANFLITWQNIKTIIHYPNRKNYDFTFKSGNSIGFGTMKKN